MDYQLTEEEIEHDFIKNGDLNLYDGANLVYQEKETGYWKKFIYDEDDNLIYYEDSHGYWEKRRFYNKEEIYYENSYGFKF